MGKIDIETLNISIRRGENYSFFTKLTPSAEHEEFFKEVSFDFVIMRDYGQEPIIKKTKKLTWISDANPVWFGVWVDLTAEETDLLSSNGDGFGKYYWGLILHKGSEYRNTIIPRDFVEKPELRVYPGLELCEE